MTRRVLVTGAGGFVGRHLTPLLAADGWEVHAVSRGAPDNDMPVTWHQADLLDGRHRTALVEAVRPDAMVHLAWSSKPPDFWTHPDNEHWLSATLDLARLFSRYGGRRFVGAGTCAEYCWDEGVCVERSTPLQPRTPYGLAKAQCGRALDAFALEVGMSVAWGRLFFIFGSHDSPLRLIPSLVRDLSAGRPARCRTGRHRRDFLHVADAAGALMALLESDVTGPVNIGSGVAHSIEEIATRVASTLDAAGLLTIEPGPPEDTLVLADVSRLKSEVGWHPPSEITSRLEETIAWWRSAAVAEDVR